MPMPRFYSVQLFVVLYDCVIAIFEASSSPSSTTQHHRRVYIIQFLSCYSSKINRINISNANLTKKEEKRTKKKKKSIKMNKFKTMKYKTNTTDVGLFDKLSKYSTVRFLRSKSNGRKNVQTTPSSTQPLSGSYDMNGRESDDHKLEIGAPILISKTTLDFDTIDPIKENNISSDQSDVFLDANSSSATTPNDSKSSYHSITTSIDDNDNNVIKLNEKQKSSTLDTTNTNLKLFSTTNRSKSTTNLHKAELSIYLDRKRSNENYNRSMSNLNHNIESKLSLTNNNDNNFIKIDIDNNDNAIYDEFDLKSASFHSLNAQNIFLSIDELNDITKQLNENDEYKSLNLNDLDYCKHRDNLRPCERRITLLRNKNPNFFIANGKKDKLTNAWCDFKLWIGEEKVKIKDVVNKHTTTAVATTATTATGQRAIQSSNDLNANVTSDVSINGRTNHNNDNSACIDGINSLNYNGNRCGDDYVQHECNGNSLQSNASMISKVKLEQDNGCEVKNKNGKKKKKCSEIANCFLFRYI